MSIRQLQNHNVALKIKLKKSEEKLEKSEEKLRKCEEKNKNLLELGNENAELRKQIEELIETNRKQSVAWITEASKTEEKIKSLNEKLEEQEFSIILTGVELRKVKTEVSNVTKELAEKKKDTQQLIKVNSQLRTDLSAQTSTIELLEQTASFPYTLSQVERDQQENSILETKVEHLSAQNQALSHEVKKCEKMLEDSISKFKNIESELNRYQEILNSIFSLFNSDSKYYGQTTPFFENRHLAERNLPLKFEISEHDRIFKHFLNLVGSEAKIRMEEIAVKGEFKTWSGNSFVNNVIFGQTLDMDVKKSQSGLSFCFTKHNPARMHKDYRGKFNHFSK